MGKISLVCTLKNEETLIEEFLNSILSQSLPPDEIIIVDGGSTDNTVAIIKSYIEKGSPIKLIIEKNANIAKGRNIAIRNASYELIAVTDAGCRIDKDWLKNLIEPFRQDENIDVASGWYEADVAAEFEKTIAELTYPKLEEVLKNPDDFLPSSRSVAFKKAAWLKAGGYPQRLTLTAEDTLFDINLKRAGCKFVFAPKAVVYWKVRSNLKSFLKQYYLYAKGDREGGLFAGYYLKLLFKKYVTAIFFIALGFKWKIFWALCLLGAGYYWGYIAFKYPRHLFRAPMITILKELAQVLGWLSGRRRLL